MLVLGESGCGKTTLLRMIKRELSPFGDKSGSITYNGIDTDSLSASLSASDIGFVGQNPDEQIVTDKVWHELAFGLENLGLPNHVIHRRVGEIASYFGIQNWYHKNTDELSGGQKQLLNLAAVMVMQPKLLLLDEPTSQLDPIAASDFIFAVRKLNRELGLTVILTEHRLEEVFPSADRVVVMERGRVICEGEPKNVCLDMKGHKLFSGFPSAARIWNDLNIKCDCPLTVKEGREFLECNFHHKAGAALPESQFKLSGSCAVKAKDIWFRYNKSLPDVLKGLNISVQEGEIFSILGGNGAGKTTLLNILSGIDRPYKGKVRINGIKITDFKNESLYRHCLAVLPQNPKLSFLKDSVRADFEEILHACDIPKTEHHDRIFSVAEQFGIIHLIEKHPYDLSGGEQQKCALVKLLLTEPRILLLDEPTKGMDAFSKQSFGQLLHKLKLQKKTILMVTHDIEFSAAFSDRCALLFDGELLSADTPSRFFSGNNYYTTAASRISRELFKNTVLCEDVIAICKAAEDIR